MVSLYTCQLGGSRVFFLFIHHHHRSRQEGVAYCTLLHSGISFLFIGLLSCIVLRRLLFFLLYRFYPFRITVRTYENKDISTPRLSSPKTCASVTNYLLYAPVKQRSRSKENDSQSSSVFYATPLLNPQLIRRRSHNAGIVWR